MPQTLPLTRGFSALVDDSDYPTLAQWKWLYVGSGYAGRFVTAHGKKSLVYLHRHLLNPDPASASTTSTATASTTGARICDW